MEIVAGVDPSVRLLDAIARQDVASVTYLLRTLDWTDVDGGEIYAVQAAYSDNVEIMDLLATRKAGLAGLLIAAAAYGTQTVYYFFEHYDADQFDRDTLTEVASSLITDDEIYTDFLTWVGPIPPKVERPMPRLTDQAIDDDYQAGKSVYYEIGVTSPASFLYYLSSSNLFLANRLANVSADDKESYRRPLLLAWFRQYAPLVARWIER